MACRPRYNCPYFFKCGVDSSCGNERRRIKVDFLDAVKIINKRNNLLPLFNRLWNSLDKKNKKKAEKPFHDLMKKILYEKRKDD